MFLYPGCSYSLCSYSRYVLITGIFYNVCCYNRYVLIACVIITGFPCIIIQQQPLKEVEGTVYSFDKTGY